MPIYKGSNIINHLYKGNQSIGNVYKGDTLVYNPVQLPYRVHIVGDGPINTYATAVDNWEQGFIGYSIPLYFSVDNTSNSGSIWYGIVLNEPAFNWMYSINNNQDNFFISKDGWHNFISLYIGYDVTDTDFSNFTINDPFYALDLEEWSTSTQQPIDPTNTHAWVFTNSYGGYYVEYRLLNSSDFNYIASLIEGGATLIELQLAPLGYNFSGAFGADIAGLLVSQQINFNYVNDIPMALEWLTNNGVQVNSTLLQSDTNNFNFSIYSKFTAVLPEVAQLGWGTPFGLKMLQINSYTPPSYNVPGTLELELVAINDEGENE